MKAKEPGKKQEPGQHLSPGKREASLEQKGMARKAKEAARKVGKKPPKTGLRP